MGGKALKEHNAVRLDKQNFDRIADEVTGMLNELGIKHELVKSYRTKSDFGDLDVLVVGSAEPFVQHLRARYSEAHGVEVPVVRNGPVISVGLPERVTDDGIEEVFQVDLIQTTEEEVGFSSNYFAWNDMGNLLGRIAHKFGLKLGHDGLWVIVREDTHVVGEICLTRNFFDALRSIGYDEEVYRQGFDTLEDIYQFVVSSEFFNPEIFKLENRNHTARMRDRKRPVYMEFLKWLDGRDTPRFHFVQDKTGFIEAFVDAFGKRGEYDELLRKREAAKEQKEVFNGRIVSELTGLKEVELGNFMRHLKSNVTPFKDGADAVVEYAKVNCIVEKILDEYQKQRL